MKYELVEQAVDGYQSQLQQLEGTVLSAHEFHITFHNYLKESAHLVIEKIGVGEGFNQNKDFIFDIWINGKQLDYPITLKAGEVSQPITLNMGDTWKVVEKNVFDDEYSQTELLNGTGVVNVPNQRIKVSQTNTYVGKPMMDLQGQKSWSIPENVQVSIPEKIVVELKDKDRVVAIQEVTGPEWRYQFHVPKLNEKGKVIQYTVEEVPIDNFYPVYEANTINITNVYRLPVLSKAVPIEKVLVGDTPPKEEIVEFRLSPGHEVVQIKGKGQATFAPITFSQAGTYTYTITERNKGVLGYTYDSSIYTWTIVVVEKEHQLTIASEEFKKDGNAYTQESLVFKNQFDASKIIHEKITISGYKTWNYGTQPKEEHPQSITVLLIGNGKVVYQQEISEKDNWTYSFTVNSHDKGGKKIRYSIDELSVPEYKKSLNGNNLTNTYIGSVIPEKENNIKETNSMKSRGTVPKTGEKRSIFLIVIGVVLIMVSGWICMYRRKNRGS